MIGFRNPLQHGIKKNLLLITPNTKRIEIRAGRENRSKKRIRNNEVKSGILTYINAIQVSKY
jgi:hypothetical protein